MADEKKSRTAGWRSYAVNLLLFVAVVAGVRVWQQRDMTGGIHPPLQGMTLAGQPYLLSEHPAQPVLVHFWASWCQICRTEQGAISAIAHDHPNMVSIAMQSGGQAEVLRHMRERGIDFPVLNDPQGNIARAWGVHGVPASFIISPDGKVRFVEVGYTTGIGIRLRLWLAGI